MPWCKLHLAAASTVVLNSVPKYANDTLMGWPSCMYASFLQHHEITEVHYIPTVLSVFANVLLYDMSCIL